MSNLHFSACIIIGFLFVSCATTFQYLHGEQLENSDEGASMQIDSRYVGVIYNHSVFEVTLTNNSNSSLYLDTKSISLYVQDRITNNELQIKPRTKAELKKYLYLGDYDRLSVRRVNYRKGPYVQDGSRVPKIDYLRRSKPRFLALEGFDGSKIEYIDNWVFERINIPPGKSKSFDLVFFRRMLSGNAYLEVDDGGTKESVEYDFDYMLVKE